MTHARIGKNIRPDFSLDVNFAIGAGVTAIYGPAGAGKTVLLESIAGLVRPDSGRILLEDVILFDAASGVHVPPRLRQCAYIGQTEALFPHMTLRRNLMFAARRRRACAGRWRARCSPNPGCFWRTTAAGPKRWFASFAPRRPAP